MCLSQTAAWIYVLLRNLKRMLHIDLLCSKQGRMQQKWEQKQYRIFPFFLAGIYSASIPGSSPSKSAHCDKYIHSLSDIILPQFIYFLIFSLQVCTNAKTEFKRCCLVEEAV